MLVLGEDWRFAVFGPRGQRVREGRIPGPVSPGVFAHVIDAEHIGAEVLVVEARRRGAYRNQRALVVRAFTGASDTVAILNSERSYFEPQGQFGAGYDAPFTPMAHSAAGDGVYWFGITDVPEIYGYRVVGQVRDTIRFSWAQTPVTRADRSRWVDERSSSVDPSRTRGADLLGFPDSLPYWGALHVDGTGNVWVLRYEVAWAEGPQRWSVFTPAGESIATVTFPRTIAPDCEHWCSDLLDIGENYVLLARPQPPYRVPQVHVHRLIRDQ